MASADRVVVLAGGLSHEREVSLRSGRRVADALRDVGVEVEQRDVDAALVPVLCDRPPRCVFPLLHGESGEDGAVREVLDLLAVPYVGSVPQACRVAFDKPVAAALMAGAGVCTPESVVLPHETIREVGAAPVMAALVDRLGLPLVVKPTRGGSALGFSVVRRVEDLPAAMVGCFAYGPVALVQRYVAGTEVAVAVLDAGGGPRPLPAVHIDPEGGVYDYRARYSAGATRFAVPAPLADPVAAECARVAVAAHRTLGLRDLSRSDLIVEPDGRVQFLEVNVAPGMTETSLVPLALQEAGHDLGEVCRDLVVRAAARAGG